MYEMSEELDTFFNSLGFSDNLKSATREGDLNEVKNIMTEENKVIKDSRGYTLLHYASGSGNMDMVRYVYEKNPKIKLDNNGHYPWESEDRNDIETQFVLYCEYGVEEITINPFIKYMHRTDLLKRYYSDKFMTQGQCGNTPLHFACIIGNVEAVKVLSKSPRLANEHGQLPIEIAIMNECVEIVKILYTEGIEDRENDFGETVLMRACLKTRNPEIIEILQNGDFTKESKGRVSPISSILCNPDLIKRYWKDEYKEHYEKIGFPILSKCLVDCPCPGNVRETVEFLLSRGVEDKPNKYGETLYSKTLNIGSTEYLDILPQNDIKNSDGEIPFFRAVESGNLELVKILATPERVMSKNVDGETPLDYSESAEMTEFLQSVILLGKTNI